MNEREQELQLRKQQLLAESARLRDELARQAAAWEPLFGAADRLRAVWVWLRAHPGAVLGAGAALVVWRPRRAFRWAGRALTMWRVYLDLKRRFRRAMARGEV
ncbi:MAG: hypothetical protein KF778_14050 [Rhodocyclaceae bacterium]|nr:hypothetical protein [Rhodocyclaceae bacterium]MBX3669517.1 hypothetical protein [Rhodocyclaceae bacterium]